MFACPYCQSMLLVYFTPVPRSKQFTPDHLMLQGMKRSRQKERKRKYRKNLYSIEVHLLLQYQHTYS